MRNDLQIKKLRLARKGVINALLKHEEKRDKLLLNEKGEYSPDWEAHKLQGKKSLEMIEEIDNLTKQIYELQGKTFEENA